MNELPHGEVTRALHAVTQREPGAKERLFGLVFDEVRRIAAGKVSASAHRPAPDPTELVGEVYLRLFGTGAAGVAWNDRSHFYCTVALVMRNILVDQARRAATAKRGGTVRRVELNEQIAVASPDPADVLAIDEALTKLEVARPPAAQAFMLEHFAGLSHAETALAMGIAHSMVRRHWDFAVGFLTTELGPDSAKNLAGEPR